jgi:hypothetical protein
VRRPREATLASLPAEALEVAADVVTLSGLGRALEHESRHADERQRRWYWYVKEPDRVAAAIRRAYRREALVETATRHVATRLGDPAAGEAVAWLRSPFSRRVLEVEKEADSPERHEEIEEVLSGLPDAPPDPGRVALLARLGRAVGLTYPEVASYDTMARDFQRTTWKLLTPAGRSWANQLTPSLDGRLSRVEWTAFQTMVTLLTTYRPLSDAELEELVRFSESPAGAWAARAFREGLLGALDAARERADGALHGSRR